MNWKRKVGVCMVFGLGMLAVAVSIARAVYIGTTGSSDTGAGGFAFITWSITEPAVGLICACLPISRPLYRLGVGKIGAGWAKLRNKRSGISSSGDGERGDQVLHAIPAPTVSDKGHVKQVERSWYKHFTSEHSVKDVDMTP